MRGRGRASRGKHPWRVSRNRDRVVDCHCNRAQDSFQISVEYFCLRYRDLTLEYTNWHRNPKNRSGMFHASHQSPKLPHQPTSRRSLEARPQATCARQKSLILASTAPHVSQPHLQQQHLRTTTTVNNQRCRYQIPTSPLPTFSKSFLRQKISHLSQTLSSIPRRIPKKHARNRG